MLIFTLIFTLKTNMSYKSTIFAIAIHPNFQNFLKKPIIFDFFILFPSVSAVCHPSSFVPHPSFILRLLIFPFLILSLPMRVRWRGQHSGRELGTAHRLL